MMPMMPPDMFKMFENFAKHAEIIMKFQNTCMQFMQKGQSSVSPDLTQANDLSTAHTQSQQEEEIK
jgi:hypothetical protein